jgi:hypothetical protein
MKRVIFYSIALLVIALLVAMLPSGFIGGRPREPKTPVVNMDIKNLSYAMRFYKDTFGRYPSGDNLKIVRSLSRDNPGKSVFLDLSPRSVNSFGQFVDPWGTPYGIEITFQTSFVIRSAGPDQKFGNKDDVVFDSTSNDFVKP